MNDSRHTAPLIHPQAVVSPDARLGEDVSVGPFAVIEDDVEIGAGCRIESHAVLRRHLRMGRDNRVEPFAVLGGPPQDLGFDAQAVSHVEIGDGCIFREGVTVNRSARPGGTTRVGSLCFLMNNTHVAHDCMLGDGVIVAGAVAMAGHVQIGDGAFIGGGTMVHQHARIGALAMVRGMSAVDKDVIPYTLVGGTPLRHYRLNLVGLRRRGLDAQRIAALSEAFRRMRSAGRASAYLGCLEDLPETPELADLRDWLAAPSRRGPHAFASARRRAGDSPEA